MPATATDLTLAEELSAAVGRDRLRIFPSYRDVDAYLGAVGSLDLFVGMRLHSYIARRAVCADARHHDRVPAQAPSHLHENHRPRALPRPHRSGRRLIDGRRRRAVRLAGRPPA